MKMRLSLFIVIVVLFASCSTLSNPASIRKDPYRVEEHQKKILVDDFGLKSSDKISFLGVFELSEKKKNRDMANNDKLAVIPEDFIPNLRSDLTLAVNKELSLNFADNYISTEGLYKYLMENKLEQKYNYLMEDLFALNLHGKPSDSDSKLNYYSISDNKNNETVQKICELLKIDGFFINFMLTLNTVQTTSSGVVSTSSLIAINNMSCTQLILSDNSMPFYNNTIGRYTRNNLGMVENLFLKDNLKVDITKRIISGIDPDYNLEKVLRPIPLAYREEAKYTISYITDDQEMPLYYWVDTLSLSGKLNYKISSERKDFIKINPDGSNKGYNKYTFHYASDSLQVDPNRDKVPVLCFSIESDIKNNVVWFYPFNKYLVKQK